MKENKYNYSRNNKKAIISYVIGIVVDLIYLWLAKDHAYGAGVLSVVSWVFINIIKKLLDCPPLS